MYWVKFVIHTPQMQIVLFEDRTWSKFLPLVYTKPVGDLRIGILKIAEKYQKIFNAEVHHETRVHLHGLFPPATAKADLHINARLLPDRTIVEAISSLSGNQSLMHDGVLLAEHRDANYNDTTTEVPYEVAPILLHQITDLYTLNSEALKFDFDLLTKSKRSIDIHATNTLIGNSDLLYIAPGAKAYASTFNTTDGPIFIDADAEVMEGSHIRGPFYLGEHSQLKMGTKIYGATTIGPHCKVGGEVSNSIIQGFSNKAHDGFIGNTLIGEWCNLGADTNTSNLKNNYSKVRIWSYRDNQYADTGLTFCGLIMGDHSKCGINTMFNTGTVVGACSNIYGGGFPSKHIPSFMWGGSDGVVEYEWSKALDTITRVMQRRSIELSVEMIEMLKYVFESTAVHRHSPTQSQE